jgi:hypothetical protein
MTDFHQCACETSDGAPQILLAVWRFSRLPGIVRTLTNYILLLYLAVSDRHSDRQIVRSDLADAQSLLDIEDVHKVSISILLE